MAGNCAYDFLLHIVCNVLAYLRLISTFCQFLQSNKSGWSIWTSLVHKDASIVPYFKIRTSTFPKDETHSRVHYINICWNRSILEVGPRPLSFCMIWGWMEKGIFVNDDEFFLEKWKPLLTWIFIFLKDHNLKKLWKIIAFEFILYLWEHFKNPEF